MEERVMELLRGRIKMGDGISHGRPHSTRKARKPRKKKSGGTKMIPSKKVDPSPKIKKIAEKQSDEIEAEIHAEGIEIPDRLKKRLLDMLGLHSKEDCKCKGGKYPMEGRERVKRWDDFVKKYAKDHNMTYKEAMEDAGKAYTAHKQEASKKESKGASEWVKYVKKYAKDHNMTYRQAMKEAGPSYRKIKKQ